VDPITLGLVKDAVAVLKEIGAIETPIAFPSADAILQYTMPLVMIEMAAHHEATYPARASDYGEWITKGIETGRSANPVTLGAGMIERQKYRGTVPRAFDGIDVFVMPVFGAGTPTWTEVRAAVAKDFNIIGESTSPFNATGTPTVKLRPASPTTADRSPSSSRARTILKRSS
jgi:amidase